MLGCLNEQSAIPRGIPKPAIHLVTISVIGDFASGHDPDQSLGQPPARHFALPVHHAIQTSAKSAYQGSAPLFR